MMKFKALLIAASVGLLSTQSALAAPCDLFKVSSGQLGSLYQQLNMIHSALPSVISNADFTAVSNWYNTTTRKGTIRLKDNIAGTCTNQDTKIAILNLYDTSYGNVSLPVIHLDTSFLGGQQVIKLF